MKLNFAISVMHWPFTKFIKYYLQNFSKKGWIALFLFLEEIFKIRRKVMSYPQRSDESSILNFQKEYYFQQDEYFDNWNPELW